MFYRLFPLFAPRLLIFYVGFLLGYFTLFILDSEIHFYDNQIGIKLSLVKPKPNVSLPPTEMNTEIPVDQSELEENTLSQSRARENVCERVTIGQKNWREICKPIIKCRKLKANANYFCSEVRTAQGCETYRLFRTLFLYHFC